MDLRKKVIKVRVTEDELAQLNDKKSQSQLAAWMRDYCLNDTSHRVVNVRVSTELARELARISNNMNQIARALNSHRFFSDGTDSDSLKVIFKATYKKFHELKEQYACAYK